MISIKSLLLLKCLNFVHPTFIVQTAIDTSVFEDNVVIVGEDIDLLVIFLQLAPTIENISFLKPGIGKICEKMYTANSLSYPKLQNLIAFIHAFTGCDTISGFYNQGKTKIIKTLISNSELVETLKFLILPMPQRMIL